MLGMLVLAPALVTAVVQVSIQNFSFVPDSVRVQPGDTVRWTNVDASNHTSTGDGAGAAAWSSGTLNNAQAFQRAFPATGVFDYHCEFHPSMTARVYVGNATAIARPPAKPMDREHGAGHDAHSRDTRGRALNPERNPSTGSPAFTPQ
jgi:plastocyanin